MSANAVVGAGLSSRTQRAAQGPGASPSADERWPEVLLLGEMIGATEQAQSLVAKMDLEALEGDRLRRDASLWNFTVIGEASTQLDDHFQRRFSS